MTAGGALVAAAGFLADPAHGWCQCAVALSEKRRPVQARSPKAVRWCAIGALRVVAPELETEARELFSRRTGWALQGFNDRIGRTRDEVVEALRQAATEEVSDV